MDSNASIIVDLMDLYCLDGDSNASMDTIDSMDLSCLDGDSNALTDTRRLDGPVLPLRTVMP